MSHCPHLPSLASQSTPQTWLPHLDSKAPVFSSGHPLLAGFPSGPQDVSCQTWVAVRSLGQGYSHQCPHVCCCCCCSSSLQPQGAWLLSSFMFVYFSGHLGCLTSALTHLHTPIHIHKQSTQCTYTNTPICALTCTQSMPINAHTQSTDAHAHAYTQSVHTHTPHIYNLFSGGTSTSIA